MRRQTPVASLLYTRLFPTPGPADPPNFQTHLARDLIPEIRIETATFYGSLDSIEARYPGLNYCHAPHRMRLGRFPHHARLFKTIDNLGITDQEVMDLARWEGTLWARQRFERDENIRVRDTTGDGIIPWVDPRLNKKGHEKGIRIKVETAVEVSEDAHVHMDTDGEGLGHVNEAVSETAQLLGHDLNRRILAAIAARQQGLNLDINPELEAYLKDLVESGHLLAASRPADGPLSPSATTTETALPDNPSTLQQPSA
ncbi:hypothetical protein BDV97DRAFT_290899 [Delphinella strobiligena]|nr:hypothetical protein BDV97DRAFT_290899 [Delphinella strobiligena]